MLPTGSAVHDKNVIFVKKKKRMTLGAQHSPLFKIIFKNDF